MTLRGVRGTPHRWHFRAALSTEWPEELPQHKLGEQSRRPRGRSPAAEEVCFVLPQGTGSACHGSSLSLERRGPHDAWRCQGQPPSSHPSQRTKGFIQLLAAQIYSVSAPVLPLRAAHAWPPSNTTCLLGLVVSELQFDLLLAFW